MKPGTVAGAIGRGLVAGLAGTAAITLSQALEMKLRKRPPSTAPADAASKVLGVRPVGNTEKQRFSNVVHWGYGTAWGAVRGLLDVAGLHGLAGESVHFTALSATAMTMLPALKVAPPVQEWGAEEIAVETLHHLVYSTVTGLVYNWLKSNSNSRS